MAALASIALSLLAAHLVASSPCPLLGPAYPSPVNISSADTAFSASWSNLTSIINFYVSGKSNTSGVDIGAHSFSIGAFSIHDHQAQHVFQYHHTGHSVANASAGVNHVDHNSVYRIGSMSKLITVYLALIKAGSNIWDEPVTKFVPELAAAPMPSADTSLDTVDWNVITLGAMAAHLAGLPRDVSNVVDDLAFKLPAAGQDPTALGLPKLDPSDPRSNLTCEKDFSSPCTRQQFLDKVLQRQPTVVPWSTPVYSNLAFNVLALALENITGKAYPALLADDLAAPLGLTATTYTAPANLSTGVIPDGDPLASFFAVPTTFETPGGGLYSSLADITALGTAILNATLLSADATRAWLKPAAHTADPAQSVGRPWEIQRLPLPSHHRHTDLYTKSGDLGAYAALLILSPDHAAGTALLAAGPDAPRAVAALADVLARTALPALESDAAHQAAARFAGRYAAGNASLELAADPASGPGVVVRGWAGAALLGGGGSDADVRLYPTGLGGPGEVGFRAVADGDGGAAPAGEGPFTRGLRCQSWFEVDLVMYGGVGIDEVVVEVDGEGNGVAVRLAAFRQRLVRVG